MIDNVAHHCAGAGGCSSVERTQLNLCLCI